MWQSREQKPSTVHIFDLLNNISKYPEVMKNIVKKKYGKDRLTTAKVALSMLACISKCLNCISFGLLGTKLCSFHYSSTSHSQPSGNINGCAMTSSSRQSQGCFRSCKLSSIMQGSAGISLSLEQPQNFSLS